MKTLRLIAGLAAALAVAPAVVAQEPADSQQAPVAGEEGALRTEPQLRIRVLRHPYDLASFYRSAGPAARSPFDFSDRYPIASFYRAGGGVHPRGYSRFWTTGYSSGGADNAYRRRIGENGDLFLLAPTFLAPLGPLTASFRDEER